MDFEELHRVLDEICFYIRNLEPILEKEQTLLSSGRIDAYFLQGITQQKESLIASIASLDKRRVQLNETLRITEPYESVDVFEISKLWKIISDLSERLERKNLNNGILLQYHINFTKSAIGILQAEAGSDIYGPNGQSKSGSLLGRKITI